MCRGWIWESPCPTTRDRTYCSELCADAHQVRKALTDPQLTFHGKTGRISSKHTNFQNMNPRTDAGALLARSFLGFDHSS